MLLLNNNIKNIIWIFDKGNRWCYAAAVLKGNRREISYMLTIIIIIMLQLIYIVLHIIIIIT